MKSGSPPRGRRDGGKQSSNDLDLRRGGGGASWTGKVKVLIQVGGAKPGGRESSG